MRRLTGRVVVAALAVGGGYLAARLLAPSWSPPVRPAPTIGTATPTLPAVAPTGPIGEGNEVIRNALATLEVRPNVAAKVRQSIRYGSQQLSGTGAYWQQDVGNLRRTCWQLQTIVAGQTAFYSQVYDGNHVWTDRQTPAARTVARVDVERVRRELAMSRDGADRAAADEAAQLELLARGGLSQLVAELEQSFTFGAPRSVPRGNGTALALIGRWRPEELARQWPSLSPESVADWPAHFPHHVLVHVGADRFPYVIEYRDSSQAGLAVSEAGYLPIDDPLAGYEFIDVQFTALMPAHLFEFAPAQLDWQDVTARTLDRLRPPTPPPIEETAARRYGAWR